MTGEGWTTNGPQLVAIDCHRRLPVAHVMVTVSGLFAQASDHTDWLADGAISRIQTCAHGSGGRRSGLVNEQRWPGRI
jgi:hypothetical protein